MSTGDERGDGSHANAPSARFTSSSSSSRGKSSEAGVGVLDPRGRDQNPSLLRISVLTHSASSHVVPGEKHQQMFQRWSVTGRADVDQPRTKEPNTEISEEVRRIRENVDQNLDPSPGVQGF